LTGKSVKSKIRMHKKKEGRGKFFLSLFFLDDGSNLMGTFGTNVNRNREQEKMLNFEL